MMKDLEALFTPAVTEVFTMMLNYPVVEVKPGANDAIPKIKARHKIKALLLMIPPPFPGI